MNDDIRIVLFDAGGVLFDTQTNRNERIHKLLNARGHDSETIESGFKKAEEFWLSYRNEKWLSTWKDEEEYWKYYYKIIVDEVGDKDPFLCDELIHFTHYSKHCVLFPEVEETLKKLYEKYELGVISNAFPSMNWIFDNLNIRKYFKNIIISSFVGTSKPDRKIYEYALDVFKAGPQECLFIDNKEINVNAAKQLGMKGLVINRKLNDESSTLDRLLKIEL